jgi:hypothetical protein
MITNIYCKNMKTKIINSQITNYKIVVIFHKKKCFVQLRLYLWYSKQIFKIVRN